MRKSPLAYRNTGRTPAEFPAARFSSTGIRWTLVTDEINIHNAPIVIKPVIPPIVQMNDWGYITNLYTASMDFGSIATPASTDLDFGPITV